MFELTQQYSFVATHEIYGLPNVNPCSGVHSHRWTLEVSLTMGMLLPTDGPSELVGLDPLRKYIATEMHGRHLNDVLIGPPTPARIARHVATWGQQNLGGPVLKSLASIVVMADTASRARYILPRNRPT